ncbi:claudin 5a [Callorhinchus milii]|uniref:Claudin n=1 Tax=Callorhinchus milii TaxID=7868 RepID=V9L6C4_CALMI|nr:claudin 5a [Callorhinchus milii]|eukprot:gi/632980056/ref/XP_007906815.1/ PREDICTED: claudin-5 [Callorhinchus milii]
MASTGLEILGLALCVVGWLGVMLACGLPMWKVTAFIENNIILAQTVWEGLWMNCVVLSTGQMQCKVYSSLLALGPDQQTARALTVIASIMGLFGILITIFGAQCTNCIEGETVKARIVISGGAVFILAGFLLMIPVSWMAHTIVRDFHDPNVPSSKKREMGAALYVGWAASALLFIGGSLLCCSCPPKQEQSAFAVKYTAPRRAAANGDYDKRNYV